jgi:hypothetical protein
VAPNHLACGKVSLEVQSFSVEFVEVVRRTDEGGKESLERRATMAEYAILLYAPVLDHHEDDGGAARAEHEQHSEDLQHAGTMVAAFALEPHTMSTSIRGDVITDGPFLETKEVIAGFCIIEATDLDAALAIAKTNPICHQGGGVEVRPVEDWVIPTRHAHQH